MAEPTAEPVEDYEYAMINIFIVAPKLTSSTPKL